jgi:hypothetical protein
VAVQGSDGVDYNLLDEDYALLDPDHNLDQGHDLDTDHNLDLSHNLEPGHNLEPAHTRVQLDKIFPDFLVAGDAKPRPATASTTTVPTSTTTVPTSTVPTTMPTMYLTTSTRVVAVAYKYRIVFSLDVTPSMAAIDPVTGEVLFDQVLATLERCLHALVDAPVVIPGVNVKVIFSLALYIYYYNNRKSIMKKKYHKKG